MMTHHLNRVIQHSRHRIRRPLASRLQCREQELRRSATRRDVHNESNQRTLRIVVNNSLNAAGLLRVKQYVIEERDVLLIQLPNETGALYKATRLLSSAGVNIEHAYGCSPDAQPMGCVVMAVDNIERASMVAGV